MPRRTVPALFALLAATMLLVPGCAKTEADPYGTSRAVPEAPVASAPAPAPARPAAPFKVFNVYTDQNAPDNHYFPTGWMGDFGDLKVDEGSTNNPHSGSTSIQFSYSGQASQGARWTGVYWQNPANNWGNRPGGYDLTGATKLTFWARGEKGGERIEEFKLGGLTGEHSDSDIAGIGPVLLTTDWKQYSIDLTGKDLSSISGGFAWSTNLDAVPQGCVFYLDDIRYE